MNTNTTNYCQSAASDAKHTIHNFMDGIIEQLLDDGEASDNLYDYDGGDSYHHSHHLDKSYTPQEAVELLTELDDYEETDSGLWEGYGWQEMLSAMAAYTYGNAVIHYFSELINEIGSDDEVMSLVDDYYDIDLDMREQCVARTDAGYEQTKKRRQDELKNKILARINEVLS